MRTLGVPTRCHCPRRMHLHPKSARLSCLHRCPHTRHRAFHHLELCKSTGSARTESLGDVRENDLQKSRLIRKNRWQTQLKSICLSRIKHPELITSGPTPNGSRTAHQSPRLPRSVIDLPLLRLHLRQMPNQIFDHLEQNRVSEQTRRPLEHQFLDPCRSLPIPHSRGHRNLHDLTHE